jgi:electron transport complex protein RnfA
MEYVLLFISAVLVNNFVLSRFLGICPFLGVSKKTSTALGMSGALIFVITLSSAVAWAVDHLMLRPLHLEFLQTLTFILVIAALVQFIDIVMKRFTPKLHAALGIYLPLITTNCVVLGVALMNVKDESGLFKSTFFGFAASVGYSMALLIFAGIRERIERADPPRCFRGVAISLVTAGLLSLAFMGFNGLVK